MHYLPIFFLSSKKSEMAWFWLWILLTLIQILIDNESEPELLPEPVATKRRKLLLALTHPEAEESH